MKHKHLIKNIGICIFNLSILVACSNKNFECQDCNVSSNQSGNYYSSDFICHNAEIYVNKVIGDGHCVSLIKHCSNAPNTEHWRAGVRVWENNIQRGSIIATFNKNRYPNISGYHAAIYIKQDSRGIWVWDQWLGKPVHQRLIRWRNKNSTNANTAEAYQTVISNYD